MGKTQPSLTVTVDAELDKLDRVARRLRDRELQERLRLVRSRVRYVEEALAEEVTDPLEVLLVAVLMGWRP
ncbi:MAG: DNA polymerase II [Thermoprotei archaeon]|nr:DNA polymerase II [TACK group archaeon]